jgi:high-affinity nickel-transport protein
MNAAYGWAFAKPVRKVFYNITITAISVAVALIIGTIELVGVLADQAHITSGPIAAIGNIPLDYAGYGIVGLFFVSWIAAIAIWRFGDIEQRWSADLAPPALVTQSGPPDVTESQAHHVGAEPVEVPR